MNATLTFYPLCNADGLAIDLRDGRKMLIDFGNQGDPNDALDLRCDLAAELCASLRQAGRDYYDVVCFTHLDDDHCKGASEFLPIHTHSEAPSKLTGRHSVSDHHPPLPLAAKRPS
jgi:glyoxylase-like metal-dependent hydrolase (beta-lactamase superfamily II)